jgi:hypothetical protein
MIELKIVLQTIYAAMQDDFPFVPETSVGLVTVPVNLKKIIRMSFEYVFW